MVVCGGCSFSSLLLFLVNFCFHLVDLGTVWTDFLSSSVLVQSLKKSNFIVYSQTQKKIHTKIFVVVVLLDKELKMFMEEASDSDSSEEGWFRYPYSLNFI